MKIFLLAALVAQYVFGGLLRERQASPFDACNTRDACVRSVGLPEDYSLQAYTDCVAYLEHTITIAGPTLFTTLFVPDGSYTTTTTIGWYVF
jgi:hypothetical protein